MKKRQYSKLLKKHGLCWKVIGCTRFWSKMNKLKRLNKEYGFGWIGSSAGMEIHVDSRHISRDLSVIA